MQRLAGAFSRGPRGYGCQAHPKQGVVKYHTLRPPDPNSSVNFSDEPDIIINRCKPESRMVRLPAAKKDEIKQKSKKGWFSTSWT